LCHGAALRPSASGPSCTVNPPYFRTLSGIRAMTPNSHSQRIAQSRTAKLSFREPEADVTPWAIYQPWLPSAID
jgi:hypothetical protein